MSGIELAGVVLGAFPLVISAMEHFEECKKVAGTFYKIRRVHRKDLGKVKDCQLKFRLNLKELLLPLLAEDIVTGVEYEQLLARPGGAGWQEEHVDEALAERLGDCHERYLELLEEMQEMMVGLCRATKVDDAQFQELLRSRQAAAGTPTEQARSKLMLRAHTALQAKKIAYAFTTPQRETLLEEIEKLNSKLESVLVANDRISGLTQHTISRTSRPRIPKALLHFWRHADSIFKLISEAWTCHCKSLHCAKLWLKQQAATTVDLTVLLRFCHGANRCMQIQTSDQASHGGLGLGSSVSIRLPLRPMCQEPSLSSMNSQLNGTISKTAVSTHDTKATGMASKGSFASGLQHQHQVRLQATSPTITDLCETMKSDASDGGRYGVLADHMTDQAYSVSAVKGPTCSTGSSTATLCEVLSRTATVTFTRVQRYSIAATVASSLLQLELTPWAQEWSSNNIHFPETGQVTTLDHSTPFVLTNISTVPSSSHDSFKALGTLLLELCFGKPLDDHPLWQQPGFSTAKSNPMLRQFVACEWLKDVEGEAGEQYASAVHFCLHQAPTVLKDEKWRVEFAQAVAWPLRQCYESMHPSKRSL